MRLIDAGELLALIDKFDTNGHPIAKALRVMINGQPTVEAIPIEYIEREIDAWNRTKVQAYHAICYRHLIDDWRREQDILETTRNYSKRGDDNETN